MQLGVVGYLDYHRLCTHLVPCRQPHARAHKLNKECCLLVIIGTFVEIPYWRWCICCGSCWAI